MDAALASKMYGTAQAGYLLDSFGNMGCLVGMVGAGGVEHSLLDRET